MCTLHIDYHHLTTIKKTFPLYCKELETCCNTKLISLIDMKEKKMEISANGRMIARHILIPETFWEKNRGMVGREVQRDTAMLFMFRGEIILIFDMLWMKEPLGYIALNKNKKIVAVGVMKAWIGCWLGRGQYFIEVAPEVVNGLKKSDVLSW